VVGVGAVPTQLLVFELAQRLVTVSKVKAQVSNKYENQQRTFSFSSRLENYMTPFRFVVGLVLLRWR
jgi:hypothetical protein